MEDIIARLRRERDEAEARANREHERCAALLADLARVSAEMGLPPTIGPAPGEIAGLCARVAELEIRLSKKERIWQRAVEKTLEMIDPFRPPGEPGSYARGHYNGIICAIKTLRGHVESGEEE